MIRDVGGKTVLFLADSFLPERISAAKHMTYLVQEFSKNGDEVFVVTSFGRTTFDDLDLDRRTIRVTSLFHRSQIKVFRLVSEVICPLLLAIKFRFSAAKKVNFDSTIIYSPSIFWVSTWTVIVDDPKDLTASIRNPGSLTPAELIATLSPPAFRTSSIFLRLRMPPPTIIGIKQCSAVLVIISFKVF